MTSIDQDGPSCYEKWQSRLAASAEYVSERAPASPTIGVVLGSGLGGFADRLDQSTTLPYSDIPHMPKARVSGHPGRLVFGQVGTTTVACLAGRVHAYEGHDIHEVVFAVRLLARLGCRAVLLTNAAGGIRSDLSAGSLMLIEDHLNLSGSSPLIGWAGPAGQEFIDMTSAYDRDLIELALSSATELGLDLPTGVYASLLGPSYETPAEIRMLRTLGADAVGMSTVNEVLALRHLGVRVGAISCISNLAAGLSGQPLSHEEVKQTAASVRQRFEKLLLRWLAKIGHEATD